MIDSCCCRHDGRVVLFVLFCHVWKFTRMFRHTLVRSHTGVRVPTGCPWRRGRRTQRGSIHGCPTQHWAGRSMSGRHKWWRHRGGSEDIGPEGWEGEGRRAPHVASPAEQSAFSQLTKKVLHTAQGHAHTSARSHGAYARVYIRVHASRSATWHGRSRMHNHITHK